MNLLTSTISDDTSAVLIAVADVLRSLADRLPILMACRMRVHAEEIAAEAIRLQEVNFK